MPAFHRLVNRFVQGGPIPASYNLFATPKLFPWLRYESR